MRLRRYQVRAQVEVDALVDRVYAVAADPQTVPLYAREVTRIELLNRLDDHTALVRSHLRIPPLNFASSYRYNYRQPNHYSGVQEGGKLFRGYFSFRFNQRGARTLVTHTEGILSTIPGLAWVIGFMYYRILSRDGLKEELQRLKGLIETRADVAAT